jgi:broad specificity phosphatase PhoE
VSHRPEPAALRLSAPRTVLWLVRHAESVWNRAGLIQGQAPAPGLTRSGAAQARALADMLAGTGAAVVVSSDLRRAVETARPIAVRLAVAVATDQRLRERNLGQLEGTPASVLGPALLGDTAGPLDVDIRPPGGETLRELYSRVKGWLEAVRTAPPAPVFVAVTHDGVLRAVRACLAGLPPEAMAAPPIPNGVAWRVELRSGPQRPHAGPAGETH